MSLRWRKAACFHQEDLPLIYTPDLIQFCTNTSCVILLKAFSKVRRQTVISADLTSVSSPLFSPLIMFHSSNLTGCEVAVQCLWRNRTSVLYRYHFHSFGTISNWYLWRESTGTKKCNVLVETTAAGVTGNMFAWWGHKQKPNILGRCM